MEERIQWEKETNSRQEYRLLNQIYFFYSMSSMFQISAAIWPVDKQISYYLLIILNHPP